MKKTIILVFLLMMSFLVTSSYSYTIPTEPNTTKEFALSTDYETHNQSITSFRETIEDDVLLYPDGLLTDEFFATGGDTGFGNTYAVDASYFVVAVDNELEFDDVFEGLGYIAGDGITGYFTYSIYGVLIIAGDHSNVEYSRDGVSWSAPFDDIDTTGYHTGTVSIDLQYTETFYLNFESATQIDYAHLQFFVDPVPDTNVFIETFVDVSDWVITQGTITTDNDLGNITRTSGSYAYAVHTLATEIDFSGYYLEVSVGAGIEDYFIQLRDIGDGQLYTTGSQSGVGTFKQIIPSAIDTAKIWIFVDDTEAAGSEWVQFDYLRIGISDEMGWQHDGSTLEGLTFAGTSSTNGDTTTLTATGATQAGYFITDTTATVSGIPSVYYPFLEFNVTSTTSADSDCWLARVYDTDGNYNNIPPTELAYVNLTGVFRVNLEALPALNGYPSKVLFYLQDSGDSITVDYMKLHSIANWTITQGNMETNDVCYVNSTSLVTTGDGGSEYFAFGYDPSLSVEQVGFTSINLSISDWTDPDTNDDQFWYQYYVGGWVGQEWDETSDLLPTGTTTDFRIYVYVSLTLESISFLEQLPEWNEIIEAEFYLLLAIDETSLNMALVFLGLIMIPSSTIYLVVGGRESLSNDKVFFFLIGFAIGWALVIGGIM